MSRDHCSLEREELVAWHEGTLDPQRSAELAVHINQCPVCRHQVETATEIDSVFQQHWPLVSDPEGEQRTIAALYGFESSRWNERTLAVALVTALVIPLVAIALLWPPPTGASSRVSGLINAARQHVGQIGSNHGQITNLPSEVMNETQHHAIPETLSMGLALIGQESRQDGGIRLQYANQEGDLELRVNQGASDMWEDTLITREPRFTQIDGIGIAWIQGQQEGTVSAFLWERYDTVYSILVINGGLELDDGLQIVKIFFDEQDRA